MGKAWTKEEIDLIRSDLDMETLCRILDRSYCAIATKKHLMANGRYSLKYESKIMPDVKDQRYLYHAADIYPMMYNTVQTGIEITCFKTREGAIEDGKKGRTCTVLTSRFTGVIVEKYPYFCRVKENGSNRFHCIPWADVAIYNPELFQRGA